MCSSLDLCSVSDADADAAVQAATFNRATPVGGTKAGTYTKDSSAKSLATCLASCCASERACDTVFFHHEKCFLIRCNSEELCAPQTRKEAKFEDTVMISVRDVVGSEDEGEGEEEHTTAGRKEGDETHVHILHVNGAHR